MKVVAEIASPRLVLRLMCVTDLHANLYPYDYFRDRFDKFVGLAMTAGLIREARRESANSLLFDNGYILRGTPLGDWAAAESANSATAPHPVVAAMNALHYSAATLGNHDFNYGLDVLERAYADANFPITCCNIRRVDGKTWFPRSVVLQRSFADEAGTAWPLMVGVIGFAPPQIARWDETHVSGSLEIADIDRAAREEVVALRHCDVDLVVAFGHSGISRLASKPDEENAGQDLARIDGIDALFLGHQHLLLPGEDFADVLGLDAARGMIGNKLAVMAGFRGSHLGIIDLALERSEGAWRVASAHAETRPIARRDENGAVVALVEFLPLGAGGRERGASAHTLIRPGAGRRA